MAGLTVEIVTPSRVAWKGEVEQIQAPGFTGEFGALPGHANLLSLTRAGVVTLHQAGGQTTQLVVGSGFAEVGPDQATLLVDLCELASEVDKAAAEKAWAEATDKLGFLDPDSDEHKAARKAAEIAAARMQVS